MPLQAALKPWDKNAVISSCRGSGIKDGRLGRVILVTGAAGSIGSQAAVALKQRGDGRSFPAQPCPPMHSFLRFSALLPITPAPSCCYCAVKEWHLHEAHPPPPSPRVVRSFPDLQRGTSFKPGKGGGGGVYWKGGRCAGRAQNIKLCLSIEQTQQGGPGFESGKLSPASRSLASKISRGGTTSSQSSTTSLASSGTCLPAWQLQHCTEAV